MSIFGQVGLWSAAAFVAGALLTWLLLVRPAQTRIRVLEGRLRAASAAPAAPSARLFEPEPEPYPSPSEPEFCAGGPEPDPPQRFRPEPEPAGAEPERAWLRKGHDEAGDEEREERAEPPAREFVELGSVLGPDPEVDTETTSVFEKLTENPTESLTENPTEDKGSERGTLFAPGDAPAAELPVPEPQPSAYAFGGEAPSADESAAVQALPRRQPRQPGRDGSAQPALPRIRPIERREPVPADDSGRGGSLFEPAMRRDAKATAADSTPTPLATRVEQPESTVPPGPFGPGSGMPRPGGGRPSDDFAVKASVTALRYCTEGSPHYARMVAEVWFRTVADAERVGFRPIT